MKLTPLTTSDIKFSDMRSAYGDSLVNLGNRVS